MDAEQPSAADELKKPGTNSSAFRGNFCQDQMRSSGLKQLYNLLRPVAESRAV